MTKETEVESTVEEAVVEPVVQEEDVTAVTPEQIEIDLKEPATRAEVLAVAEQMGGEMETVVSQVNEVLEQLFANQRQLNDRLTNLEDGKTKGGLVIP